MVYLIIVHCACVILHVSHSNLTKQALLAHIVAQFVEKQQAYSFFWHTLHIVLPVHHIETSAFEQFFYIRRVTSGRPVSQCRQTLTVQSLGSCPYVPHYHSDHSGHYTPCMR